MSVSAPILPGRFGEFLFPDGYFFLQFLDDKSGPLICLGAMTGAD